MHVERAAASSCAVDASYPSPEMTERTNYWVLTLFFFLWPSDPSLSCTSHICCLIPWPSQSPEVRQPAVSVHFQPTAWWDWHTGPVRSPPASHTPAPWSTGWMEYSYHWNKRKETNQTSSWWIHSRYFKYLTDKEYMIWKLCFMILSR